MSAPTLKPTGQAAVQSELLARLGLPASASPEDVDQLHQAVSEFLAAAPSDIRGWARAQTAALDAAYLQLTDPVGLEGSALMSPASPPAVVPGGPATPPARRGSDPAAPTPAAAGVEPPAVEAEDLDIGGEPTAEDLAALYAMVTPSVHDDMKPDARRPEPARTAAQAPVVAASAAGAAPASANIWKRIVIGAIGVAAVVAIGFGANALVGGGAAQPTEAPVAAEPTAPAVDMAKVAQLMERLQADPQDISALMDLGTEYYNGNDMATAGEWFDKVLAVDAQNVNGLLARGAVYFNLGAFADAERTWLLVVDVEPDNVEAHYDLGFLYLNQSPPDWTGVQSEWNKVIDLDPTSELAATVKSHLESLAGASMLPASSADPGATPSAAPSVSATP